MPTLITGGAGFLGLNLSEALLTRGDEVVVFDATDVLPEAARRRFEALPGSLEARRGDVTDRAALEAVVRDHRVDRVIHAAAITPGPEREVRDARRIVEVNLMGTLAMIEVAVAHDVTRFVYPSSASVYGANAFDHDELDEVRTPPVPNAFYAIGKYAAERAVARAAEIWGLPAVVARVGAAFGPWERDTGVRDTLSAPMRTLRAALRGEEVVLPRPGPRDWIYSRDVAAALIALLDAPTLAHALYNVSAGRRWTVAQWCDRLAAAYPDFRYSIDPAPGAATVEFGPRDRAPLRIERLTELMQPSYGLEAAFDDYRAWVDGVDDFWMR